MILDKLKKLFGGQVSEPMQTDLAQVTEAGRRLDDHPSDKITPAKLKGLLEDAENGDLQAQHELFMDIEERDATILANIQTRKRAALTLDWSIVAPRDATEAEEQQAEEVKALFSQFGYMEDLIIDCMDAVGHGFAALEIEWARVNGKWLPKRFHPRPASWFRLDKDDNLLLKTPQNALGEPLIPYGWVVHIHKSRSTQLARNGIYRTLAWLYMFKHYSSRDFAEFLELYGMPIRIGKFNAGASREEKNALLRALASIGHNAAGIMPDSMEIELHNAASGTTGTNPFLQMIEWCEKSMARLILGQTLTSGADGKSSTNALGNVHNEVRRDLLLSDVKQLAQTFTQQIILPYLKLNTANVDELRIPRFEFDTQEREDLTAFAESLPKLVDVGVAIPESWVREKLGIPEAQEDEVVLKRVQTEFKADLNSAKNSKKTALSHRLHASSCPCGCGGNNDDLQAVKLSQHFANETPQGVLDGSLDEALTQVDFNAQLDPMVKQVVALLVACGSYEQASERLAALYPKLHSQQHFDYLNKAMFLSELLGIADIEQKQAELG